MDALAAIFKQLGADISFYYQFAIFTVFFFVLKPILFNKVQEVVELRENKTTKLDSNADSKYEEAEELSKQYDERVKSVNTEAFDKFNSKKNQAQEEKNSLINTKRAELDKVYDEKRAALLKEVGEKRSEVLDKAQGLSEELLNKLV